MRSYVWVSSVAFIQLFCVLPAVADSAGRVVAEEAPLVVSKRALSEQDLDQQRAKGAGGVQLSNLGMHADLNNNLIDNSNTGGNAIDGSSFSSFTGFATVIQNSGNDVVIQNATIVNVTIEK